MIFLSREKKVRQRTAHGGIWLGRGALDKNEMEGEAQRTMILLLLLDCYGSNESSSKRSSEKEKDQSNGNG